MKKRILMTSLLLAAGAIALASCGSKKTVDSNNGESNSATNNENSGENNQNQEENYQETNYKFFDENSFELPADFNYKNLKKIELSLKQRALIEEYKDITAYEGKVHRTQTLPFASTPFEMSSDTTYKGELYSNNVLYLEDEQVFDNGGFPIDYYGPSTPVVKPIVIDKPVVSSLKAPALTPYPVGPFDIEPYNYSDSYLGIARENYSFYHTKYVSDEIFDENSYFNTTNDASSLVSRFYNAFPEPPFPYYVTGFDEPQYYQYDDNHIIEVRTGSSTDFENELICYKDGNPVYDNIAYIDSTSNIDVYEITDNGYDLVFGKMTFDSKSNYLYDYENDCFISLGELKTINSYEANLKFSTKEIEYDVESALKNFQFKIAFIDSYLSEYGSDLANGKINSVSNPYNEDATVQFNGFEKGAMNLEIEYDVYEKYIYSFNNDIALNVLNSKILNDEVLNENDLQTEQVQTSKVLNDLELPEDLEYQTYNDKTYIVAKEDSNTKSNYCYKIFLNVSISINEQGSIDFKVNNVDYIKTKSISYIKK